MLPSLVVRDVEEGLRDFIKKDFPMLSGTFINAKDKNIVEAFLEKPESLVKGPWVEVRLPFRKAPDDIQLPFTHLDLPTLKAPHPYEHQRRAFERLQHAHPETTLVATGTGSGKTECFLYPIIDYCLASNKEGIKAILIYPMNALAADQSKRVADIVHKLGNPQKQNGKPIRAGIYTGDKVDSVTVMTATSIINDRYVLRENPPDILLTNYKMLDFLLTRQQDQPLWKENGPDVMKYLVVDELHTFDGAQGTDLACLIRRLKDRLKLGNTLACVGTSATIGGPDSIAQLCRYASDIFAQAITPEAIVTENRLNAVEFLASLGDITPEDRWPYESLTQIARHDDSDNAIREMFSCWFPGRPVPHHLIDIQLALPRLLASLSAFQRFIIESQGIVNIHEMAKRWETSIPELESMPGTREERMQLVETMLDSLVAMISAARVGSANNLSPFLQVRSQLWVRELARVVASVSQKPELQLAADTASLIHPLKLPIIGCRECYRAAWGGVVRDPTGGSHLEVSTDLNLFYRSWFTEHQYTRLFYPVASEDAYESLLKLDSKNQLLMYWLCPECRRLEPVRHKKEVNIFNQNERCQCGSKERVLVWYPVMSTLKTIKEHKETRFVNQCPFCQEKGTLRIFGMSVASIAANVVSQVHGSSFNDDHHIIAFSDSVQDAAHRAGFMSARNYRAVIRHALVYYLQKRSRNNASLLYHYQRFSEYWLNEMQRLLSENVKEQKPDDYISILGKANFLATFIAPDMEYLLAWKIFSAAALKGTDAIVSSYPQWAILFKHVKERLSWEALVELGLRSNTGRTVLRAGAAAIYPSFDKLNETAENLWKHYKEHYSLHFKQEAMLPFLLGILEYMRNLGAFDPNDMSATPDVQYRFGEYLKDAKTWHFNLSPVLPGYGPNYPPPVPLLMVAHKTKDPYGKTILPNSNAQKTWCTSWLKKFSNALVDGYIQNIYQDAMDELEASSLVRKFKTTDGVDAWVLRMDQWYPTTETLYATRCTKCGRHYHFAHQIQSIWKDMHCMTASCIGKLEPLGPLKNQDNAYSSFPVRLNTHEHTALIDGNTRQRIETSFKNGNHHHLWNINLLSATPTLEMGIDIGALSTVLQCSMPPTQANYVQRIGRAGRRDGNALAITISGRDNHSEYFWSNPAEMIEGEVVTPGVYLGAVSVLERQLVAYALGRWISEASENFKMPDKLGDVISAKKNKKNEQDFPAAFLNWVHTHAENLYRDFMQMMSPSDSETGLAASVLSEEGRQHLHDFVTGVSSSDIVKAKMSLAQRIDNAFQKARDRKESWDYTKKELLSKRAQIKDRPKDNNRDNELNTINQQLRAISEMVRNSYTKKPLFNFMTDEGLLPNYAFPEEGVEVESVIVNYRDRKQGKNEDSNKTSQDENDVQGKYVRFNFNRSIAQALTDLTPGSRFYANRHVLHVDQFRVTSDNFEKWRLCEGCAYAEKVTDENAPVAPSCPHCGSTMWPDSGRIKTMLRAHEIIAHADSRYDRIVDNNDRRPVNFSSCQTLVYVEKHDIGDAWKIDDDTLGFGFEFLKNITLREINFGPYGGGNGESFIVANESVPLRGYRLCKECGMVPKDERRINDQRSQREHDFNCPYYAQNTTAAKTEDSPWINGIFMYREMHSEAIRLRIPVNDALNAVDADKGTQSLISAIKLGLKKYFCGDVYHLQVSIQKERSKSGSGTDRYIVIYDTVPGGTGYLKDLGRTDDHSGKPENMIRMLQKARDAIIHCECTKEEDKDGCYQCVYQYHDGGDRQQISRLAAETLLKRILQYPTEKIVKIKDSISSLVNPESSPLENLFMDRIRHHKDFDLQFYPTSSMSNAFRLTVPLNASARERWEKEFGRDPGEKLVWQLLLQYTLDSKKVDYPSRPDFTFRPLKESVLTKRPDLQAHVFTDGWKYHADILNDDTKKRQSILNTGARVWSISQEDLNMVESPQNKTAEKDLSFYAKRLCGENLHKLKPQQLGIFWRKKEEQDEAKAHFQQMFYGEMPGCFAWLCEWLCDPLGFTEKMRNAIQLAALTHPQKRYDVHEMAQYPRQVVQTEKSVVLGVPTDLPFTLTFRIDVTKDKKHSWLISAERIDDAPYNAKDIQGNDALHQQWLMFWQFANALQFGEGFWLSTTSNEDNPVFDVPFHEPNINTDGEDDPQKSLWQKNYIDVMKEDETLYQHMLKYARMLMEEGIPAPIDMDVDGIDGYVQDKPTGLKWENDVYLFAPEDVNEEIKKAKIPGITIVIAGMENWIEIIRKGIQA